VAREIWRQHPALFSLLEWKYGAPIELLVWKEDGTAELLEMPEGLIQGCPLAGHCFSATLAPRLVRLLEACSGLDLDALLDDIVGSQAAEGTAELDRAEAIMTGEEWQADGFLINLAKTREGTGAELQEGKGGCFKLLGAWIGDSVACAGEVRDKLDKWLPRMERAGRLSKQTELLALRMCWVPKVQFWLRTMPASAALSAQWERFDGWVQSRVEALAEVAHLSEAASGVASLPLRGGGLGLYSQQKLHRIARGAATVRVRWLLLRRARKRNELIQRTGNEGVGEVNLAEFIKTTEVGSVMAVASVMHKTVDELWDLKTRDDVKGLQHEATVQWQTNVWRTWFLEEAPGIGAQYRLVEGSSRVARAALQVIPTSDVSTHLSDREVKLMLRYKLGQGMREYFPSREGVENGGGGGCTVCNRQFFNSEHALTCARSNGHQQRNYRHTRLQRLLAFILRRAGCTVVTESCKGMNGGDRMDLTVVTRGAQAEALYVDVGIAGPTARIQGRGRGAITEQELDTAIAARKTRQAAERAEAAARGGGTGAPDQEALDKNQALLAARELLIRPQARQAEQRKKSHYGYLTKVAECQKFLPLIFTAGGTMSPTAARFLKSVGKRGDHNDDGSRAAMPGPTWLQLVYQQMALLYVRQLPGYFGQAVTLPAVDSAPTLEDENYV
jgi:hypothetical protein